MNLYSGSPDFYIGAVALENAVGRISASSIERPARPVARAFGVLIFIHDSCCWLMCGSVTRLCRQLRQFRKIHLANRIILWILRLSNCLKYSNAPSRRLVPLIFRCLFSRKNQTNRRPSKFSLGLCCVPATTTADPVKSPRFGRFDLHLIGHCQ